MNGKTHRIGPSTIQTAKDFASEELCHEYLAAKRWPDGVRCLQCNHNEVYQFVLRGKVKTYANGETKAAPDRFLYQCHNCGYQFAATTGTLFSDTHLELRVWMQAIALMCTAKKGISAKQMERTLGVSYKTAWYLNHRIRKAMEEGLDSLFTGTVEADETYVGGRYDRRRKRAKYDKEVVFGMVERETGRVHAKHVPSATRGSVTREISAAVGEGARFMDR
jgi:transposase-like protein